MPKDTFIVGGLIKKIDLAKGKLFGDFNLNKWFKETAKRYHIPFYDECCPEASEAGFSVRLKADKSGIEYLDTDLTWKDVATP